MRQIPEREIAHRAGCEPEEARSEHVAESADVDEESVVLQAQDQPVRGGASQTRAFHHVREGSSPALDRAEHGHTSVEDADGGAWRVPSKLLGCARPPGADP